MRAPCWADTVLAVAHQQDDNRRERHSTLTFTRWGILDLLVIVHPDKWS